MEIAAVAVQQSIAQSNVAMTMVKQAAKAEQSIVELVASSVNGRGQNLDILA